MNILLVNDDGFDAKGIKALKEILKEYGTIYTIAPSSVKSGAAAGLTSWLPIKYHKIDEYNYTVDGTPVDCVQFASVMIKEKIDLVVSGCNCGYNLSLDTMYSGTCGACFEALIFSKKAIAISADKFKEPTQILTMGKQIFDFIFKHDLLSTNYYLNVNLPHPEYETAKGIKITKLHRRHTPFEVLYNNEEEEIIRIHHLHDDIFDDDTYDVSAVSNGYISITPMRLINYNDEDYFDVIKKVEKENI